MKWSELCKKLSKDGWYLFQHRGSHDEWKHPYKENSIMVPRHNSKEANKGLVKSILKQAGLK